MTATTENWGRTRRKPRTIVPFTPERLNGNVLPFGNGRSYGDSCHNDSGTLLDARPMGRILAFDREAGTLRVEAGAMLGDVLTHLEGSGWFMPVVPGTRFVTIGGMLANDVHGKNHGHRGTFGRHVRSFVLHRSDGSRRLCSADENADLFAATIGGMGLTGFVSELETQLMKVPSAHVRETKTPFGSVAEGLEALAEADARSEYSVAWLDSVGRGKTFGRGIAISGDHAESGDTAAYRPARLTVPFTPPIPLVTGPALKAFNALYFASGARSGTSVVQPSSFFFPLDAVGRWNRLYGPKGLHQHQCVVPLADGAKIIEALMRAATEAGHGSFLTVLKRFGALRSPGIASFPREGVTLTLDFANRGQETLDLLDRLDAITLDAGGRTNPYKDSRMSAATYQRGFPEWHRLEALRDPACTSDFWRRVTARPRVEAPVNHTPEPVFHQPPVSQPSKETA